MNDYSIVETYTLPSKGKIYGFDVNPTVTIRSMTTREEMKRLSPSPYQYGKMCEILDDCITNELGISTYDMHIGDYQYLLYMLRVVTYGPEYKCENVCPYCGCTNTFNYDLDGVEKISDIEEYEKYRVVELPVSKKTVTLRYQTPRMLDAIEEMAKEAKKKSERKFDQSIIFLLSQIIETVDGAILDPMKVEDFATMLPMKDTNLILHHAEKMITSIGIPITMSHNCDICGLEYESRFTFTNQFFRPDIE